MLRDIGAYPGSLRLIAQLFHSKEQIGSVEAGHHGLRRAQIEHMDNILPHALGSGSREGRYHRTLRQGLYECGDRDPGRFSGLFRLRRPRELLAGLPDRPPS